MLSGSVLGTAVLLDGITQRIEEELGRSATLVVTGGLAKYVTPLCRHPLTYDPELLMKGLALLYQMNAPQHHAGGGKSGTRTSAAPADPTRSAGSATRMRPKQADDRQDGEENEIRDSGHGHDRAGILPWLTEADSPLRYSASAAPSAAQRRRGVVRTVRHPQHTTNYFELLQDVDVVYLAVPNNQHARYAKVAIEAGKHVIVEKPMAINALQAEELANLARRRKVFLFEAMTTQYLENYNKIRELLPRVGKVKLVQCNFSQYSSRYDAFCAGETPVSFDPARAGGALMDLNVYNISYIVGLFGEPNQVHYTANIERGIDTSGILTMEYNSFRAVSIAAKDCGAPARYVIQGTKGYILQKSTANWCGGVTFHPNEGKEEHYNSTAAAPAGGRVPCVRPRHRGRGPGALQPDAGYLCGRQQGADRGPAVSRTQVLTTDNALTSVSEVRINKIYPA